MPTATLPTLPEGFIPSSERFTRCLEAADKYADLRNRPESRRGDDWETELRTAARDLADANTQFDVACRLEKYVWDAQAFHLGIANPPAAEPRGPQAAFADTGRETRSAGEMFVESDWYKDHSGDMRSPEIEVRNLLTDATSTPGAGLFVPVGSPFLSPGGIFRRRFFLRDLIPVVNTNLQTVPYIREVNPAGLEGGASAVAEASAKPEVTMEFEQGDAPIRKIAAWVQASMEVLDDAPTLRGYIDTRLAYMLQIREEAELLAGGGVSPHIKGLLDYTGGSNFNLQTVSAGSDLFADVGTAIGKVENVDLGASGVVMNPLDFWAAIVTRHNTFFDGDVANFGNAPFGAPPPTIWGLPVVRNRGIASGQTLVGAFDVGATIFQREGTTIRTTDSHASLFVSNTWIILAEERLGLAVHRPDGFVLIS